MTSGFEPLRLSLNADQHSLAGVRHALRVWLQNADARDIPDLVLAVDEAVSNSIEHAGLASTDQITVVASISDDSVHVEIADGGVWRKPAVDETRGRGLPIMHSIMDKVTVDHDGERTRVVMTRRLT